MFFALDSSKNKIHISNTAKYCNYFCPICGEKLILRKGQIKRHHFAHQPHSKCNDTWHYDMSPWHSGWQEIFPKEYQEVIKTYNNVKHRADILIENKKIVIEFQHSPLSPEEFNDRNDFYNKLGYKVIWLFDYSEQYYNGYICKDSDKRYSWKYAKKTFNETIFDNDNVNLYFQLRVSSKDDDKLHDYYDEINNKGIENVNPAIIKYIDEHKDEETFIVKPTWLITDLGAFFGTTKYNFNKKEFLKMFDIDCDYNESSDYKGKVELYDILYDLEYNSDITYYSFCRKSPNNLCIYEDTNQKLNTISKNCKTCEYSDIIDDKHVCRFKFRNLVLNNDSRLLDINRDQYGFIENITLLEGTSTKTISYYIPKSIYDLWTDSYIKVAIFKNITNNYFVKLYSRPFLGKCWGYMSKDPNKFPKNTVKIYNYGKPIWAKVSEYKDKK